jgi:hypothetical protein
MAKVFVFKYKKIALSTPHLAGCSVLFRGNNQREGERKNKTKLNLNTKREVEKESQLFFRKAIPGKLLSQGRHQAAACAQVMRLGV